MSSPDASGSTGSVSSAPMASLAPSMPSMRQQDRSIKILGMEIPAPSKKQHKMLMVLLVLLVVCYIYKNFASDGRAEIYGGSNTYDDLYNENEKEPNWSGDD